MFEGTDLIEDNCSKEQIFYGLLLVHLFSTDVGDNKVQ